MNDKDKSPSSGGASDTRIWLILLGLAVFLAGGIGGYLIGARYGHHAAGRVADEEIDDESDINSQPDLPEQPAAVDVPQTYSRAGLAFQFPGNWTISTREVEFAPGTSVAVESPGGTCARIFFPTSQEELSKRLDERLRYYRSELGEPAESPFTSWGAMTGKGLELRGSDAMSGIVVRVFSYSAGGKFLLVVEEYGDKNLALVQPAFNMIAGSLTMK